MGDFSDFKQYHQTGISKMNQDHGLLSFHSKGVNLISSKTLQSHVSVFTLFYIMLFLYIYLCVYINVRMYTVNIGIAYQYIYLYIILYIYT